MTSGHEKPKMPKSSSASCPDLKGVSGTNSYWLQTLSVSPGVAYYCSICSRFSCFHGFLSCFCLCSLKKKGFILGQWTQKPVKSTWNQRLWSTCTITLFDLLAFHIWKPPSTHCCWRSRYKTQLFAKCERKFSKRHLVRETKKNFRNISSKLMFPRGMFVFAFSICAVSRLMETKMWRKKKKEEEAAASSVLGPLKGSDLSSSKVTNERAALLFFLQPVSSGRC